LVDNRIGVLIVCSARIISASGLDVTRGNPS